jgi:hypothetical protein
MNSTRPAMKQASVARAAAACHHGVSARVNVSEIPSPCSASLPTQRAVSVA